MKTIPEQNLWTCDVCGYEVTGSDKHRPKHWSKLAIYRDAYDISPSLFQDNACASANIERVMCQTCSHKTVDALNALKEQPEPVRQEVS